MAFWDRKKTKKTRRTRSTESSLKDVLNRTFVKELKRNPELARSIAFKEAGHADMILDPTASKKNAITNALLDDALKQIKDDPELRKRMSAKQVEDIVGAPSSNGDDDGHQYNGEYEDPIGKTLRDVDNLELLKERLGGGKSGSGIGSFLTPEVVSEVLKTVQTILATKAQPASQEIKYLIQINGKQTLVTESQFNELANQNKLCPVAAIAPVVEPEPKAVAKVETPKVELGAECEPEESDEKMDIGELLSVSNPDKIIGYLKMKSEEFLALDLEDDPNDPSGLLLWKLATSYTYDEIIDLVKEYVDDPKIGHVVSAIKESKDWFESVSGSNEQRNV